MTSALRAAFARWRAALRIARRDAVRHKGRTTLVALMIGLPVLVGAAGGTLIQSGVLTPTTYARQALGEHVQALISEHYGHGLHQDLLGQSFAHGAPADEPPLAEYEAAVAALLPDGDHLVQALQGFVHLDTADRRLRDAEVWQVPLEDPAVASVRPVGTGAHPAVPGEVALAPDVATTLAVGVGEPVTLTAGSGEPVQATVTGILAPAARGPQVLAAPGTALTAPESTGQVGHVVPVSVMWFVVGPEPVTWDHVLQVNDLGSTVLSRAVADDPPPRSAMPYHADIDGVAGFDAGTLAIIGAVGAIVLIEAVLLIGPAFAVGARRSARQLALVAACGGERSTLRRVVLLGGLVIGGVSSLVAAASGILAAVVVRAVVHLREPFAFPDLRVPWLAVAGMVALGAFVATTAAWFPARRAARMDVVAALAGRRSEAAPRRGVPVLGLVVFGLGGAAAVYGAVSSQMAVLVAGIVALELGLVVASGGLISAVGRLAPRFGVAGRLALRDAARQRGRTAPAVAAVIAALAGVVTGAVYTESNERHLADQYAPFAAEGTVGVTVLAPDRYDDVAAVVRATLPVTDVVPVSLVVPAVGTPEGHELSLWTVTPPEKQCPLFTDAADGMTVAEQEEVSASDPRCHQVWTSGQIVWTIPDEGNHVVVDDGSVVEALGVPGSPAAVAALREGRVVVSSGRELWQDGTVHVDVSVTAFDDHDPGTPTTHVLPGAAAELPFGQFDLVLPPQVLDELGLTAQVAGFIAPTSRTPTRAEEAALDVALRDLSPDTVAYAQVERGHYSQQSLVLLVLVAAAFVVGLGSTGISMALAAAESRPDLATLGAVGASPRVRRRVAAAQAGVIAVVGALLGVLTGTALGAVLVLSERHRYGMPDLGWQIVVPWPAVAAVGIGVPLLAMIGAYLFTRSHLPMARRIGM